MSAGIIVGYDGSDCAKEALRMGLEVAGAYGDKVIVAFAYELNPVAGEIHDYHAALKELATKRLQEALALAQASDGIETEGVIVERAPAHGLVELADERDARVIIVGTRGESPLRAAVLGSTPHRLLQLSDRPVLVVPVPVGL
jgi:nucleotide-binding universal stress UspA family protein